MAFARRRIPWARTIPDLHRTLVQAYTRLIFMPVQADGSRTAVIARFGTRDVCLVEAMTADAPPGDTPLRLELFDHAVGHAVESLTCNDLEEAEAATGVLVTDLARLSEERDGLEVIGPPVRRGQNLSELVRRRGGRLQAQCCRDLVACRIARLGGPYARA